ncbi:MAG: bifunctional pyr operon transcriptional regulator/uracil phosphoribosyltransferase PyrR [candidate division WOR-3 bacterium]|nr:bifunctional pyr operon transcriptional regulator/uracil phosphoribosyltransferase PyrR [candidate division WOR-3 bacterium]MCX7948123.1 bifunctional pyr operon transcriptional regulator/uracil phosphoribosyltransferase PyrR [candidate division WOR-3 bacterium]MDW8150799.1 bifunctional pyr operon transcriptional regulator/uracil phosphoribosyltransferase PyrR [candidate division WOR-3 bacterium]
MNSKKLVEKYKLMDEIAFFRTIRRMALEILEHSENSSDIILAGIRTRGVYLAQYLKREIEKEISTKVIIGEVDISFYRDDLSLLGESPVVKGTKLDVDIDKKIVFLVDDVLYTGRTVRAAIDVLLDFGRPKAIKLVVLIDRGWRELPIYADIVGKKITTTHDEIVKVKVKDIDNEDAVYIAQKL